MYCDLYGCNHKDQLFVEFLQNSPGVDFLAPGMVGPDTVVHDLMYQLNNVHIYKIIVIEFQLLRASKVCKHWMCRRARVDRLL